MSERIISRIKKCLAHANNANPHERATALRQAQSLMAKHGLSELDITLSEVKSELVNTGTGKDMPSYMGVLAMAVGQAFGAKVVCIRQQQRGRWKGAVEYYGVGSAAEVASYAFTVLKRQLKRDRSACYASLDKRLKSSTKLRKADIYSMSWVVTAGENLQPLTQGEKEKQVVATYEADRWPAPLEDAKTINRHHGRLNNNDRQAILRGERDGSKVKLHQGVKTAERAALTSPG